MGNRSYLGTPMGYFEANNNIPPGWFFLFTKTDFRVGWARDDHPEGDEWTWPENKDDGEEKTSIQCSTTAGRALDNIRRRSAVARSSFIRGLLPGLDTITGFLEKSPPEGKVEMDIDQYTWFYKTMKEASDHIFRLMDMLDSSLEKDDPGEFLDFFWETTSVRLTGVLEHDRAQTLEAKNAKLEDWFLGCCWPKKDKQRDEEE